MGTIIILCLIVYAVIGLAYGLYDEAVPYLRRRCDYAGGITVRDALKVLLWLPLYVAFGACVFAGLCGSAAAEWVSKAAIFDKKIIRCKRADG